MSDVARLDQPRLDAAANSPDPSISAIEDGSHS